MAGISVDFDSDATNDIVHVQKPEYLYGYKDPNAGTPLYGWTQDDVNLYTRSATPVAGMPLYDSTGVATGDTIYQVNQDGTWDFYIPTVEIILNDTTTTLTAGTYKYICIGGGASGQNSLDSSQQVKSGKILSRGGSGGYGGGSGYITYGDFTLSESTEINFVVGKGGVQTGITSGLSAAAGGTTSIIKTSDSSVLGEAAGGATSSSTAAYSSGGSGGAAKSGYYADYGLNGYYSRGPSDGHDGGLGGGNGEPHAYQVDEDAAIWANKPGIGFYNTVKSYGNNAGVKGTPGTSGGGGIGVSAIQNIITVDFVKNMDDTKLQTLYNSIGGGGSGGASTVFDTSSISGNSGAGGGGGGWFAGEAGAIDTTLTDRRAIGGKGGDGAILYVKI